MTEQIVRWPIPPQDGYSSEAFLALSDLPPHTELIDGSLVFMAPQRDIHGVIIDVVTQVLRAAAPTTLKVRREMALVLSEATTVEPDVAVVTAESVRGADQTSYRPTDVVLAVEVSSPSSLERDRDTKPHKYAGAGIRYYWRIERKDAGRLVTYTYELDDDLGRYRQTGTYVNTVTVQQPFPIDLDLSAAEVL
jgi:Uma2 family endonuclease